MNKVIIIGRLGQDPETKYMPNGNAVTNISVATEQRWTDKQTGEKQSKTSWHRIAMFGRTAEVGAEYLRKGDQCCIEGHLDYSKYEKDGVTHYSTQIICDRLELLGGKRDSQDRNSDERDRYNRDQDNRSRGGNQQKPAQRQQTQQRSVDDFDDDIPF